MPEEQRLDAPCDLETGTASSNDTVATEVQILEPEATYNGEKKVDRGWRRILAKLRTKTGELIEFLILPRRYRTVKANPSQGEKVGYKQFPFFIVSISIIQVLAYHAESLWHLWIFHPLKRHEIWRFITVLLVHFDFNHIAANLAMQLPLGCLLEIIHHWKQIGFLYFGGVLISTFASSVFQLRSACGGCSGGVYALVTAHLATILLNWREMEYAILRCLPFVSYIFYWEVVVSFYYPVGHSAHFGASVAGVCLSLSVLKSLKPSSPWRIKLQQIGRWIVIVFVVICVTANIGLHYNIDSIYTLPVDDSKVTFKETADDEANTIWGNETDLNFEWWFAPNVGRW